MPSLSSRWLPSYLIILFLHFTAPEVLKRSPLETGYVTPISDDNNQHGHHTVYYPTVLAPAAKEGASSSGALPAVLLLQKPESASQGTVGFGTIVLPAAKTYDGIEQKKPAALHPSSRHQTPSPSPHEDNIGINHHPAPSSTTHHQHTVVWLPGRVYHHSFIPAHLEHHHQLAVPSATRSHVVIHDRGATGGHRGHPGDQGLNHYGGYGVGVDTGGQGAGHGWQVVGMLYNSL